MWLFGNIYGCHPDIMQISTKSGIQILPHIYGKSNASLLLLHGKKRASKMLKSFGKCFSLFFNRWFFPFQWKIFNTIIFEEKFIDFRHSSHFTKFHTWEAVLMNFWTESGLTFMTHFMHYAPRLLYSKFNRNDFEKCCILQLARIYWNFQYNNWK